MKKMKKINDEKNDDECCRFEMKWKKKIFDDRALM
jgi:hypothetical protein